MRKIKGNILIQVVLAVFMIIGISFTTTKLILTYRKATNIIIQRNEEARIKNSIIRILNSILDETSFSEIPSEKFKFPNYEINFNIKKINILKNLRNSFSDKEICSVSKNSKKIFSIFLKDL